MPFISPVPNSPADPNRHLCNPPRPIMGWFHTETWPDGTRWQCPVCQKVYVWTGTYASDGGLVWISEDIA